MPAPLTLAQLSDELTSRDPEHPVTVRMIRRFLREGLPYVPIGSRYYVRLESFDEWIASKETRAGAEGEASEGGEA